MQDQEKYCIGVISDTHGILREEVLEKLKKCDYIFHGGDINKPEILETLQSIAPLIVVKGNNDKGKWAETLMETQKITIGSKVFFMVHNRKDVPKDLENIDVLIYGHSHKYSCHQEQKTIYLNPGSCGKRRFNLPLTMAILELEGQEIKIHPIELQP